MKELTKVTFPQINEFNFQEKIEILKSFGAYDLLDDKIYLELEKTFIKNI
jgi:hypothetical protein